LILFTNPDSSFDDYVTYNDLNTFNPLEAERLDKLMDDCFEICSKISDDRIYQIAMVQFKKSNIYKNLYHYI
jgi:hypothetical protein